MGKKEYSFESGCGSRTPAEEGIENSPSRVAMRNKKRHAHVSENHNYNIKNKNQQPQQQQQLEAHAAFVSERGAKHSPCITINL